MTAGDWKAISSLFTLVLDWNNPNSEKVSIADDETDLFLESSLINTEAVRVYTAGVRNI
ncbi:hypothetical protein M079_4779 [Bacteroides fragilis str. 3996 N(B) 6]|nr:hypothetical protein M079_4779 [Bacteroides fragilis str. 3996 N(B) 6]